MKTLLLISTLLVSLNISKSTVYICESKTAKSYHSKSSCGGLNSCTHSISEISENDAIGMGKVRCKRCF